MLAVVRSGGSRGDAMLRCLLEQAGGRGGSTVLAARVVVQAMVPAAVRMARGQVRSFGGRTFDEVGHVAIAALFEAARSGRIHGRPGRPAANLLLDALRLVCRDLAADREALGVDLLTAEEVPDPAQRPADLVWSRTVGRAAADADLEWAGAVGEGVSGARLELLELLLEAMASGTLSPADGCSVSWFYAADSVPDGRAAERFGTTAGAWQRRRSRAVRALRDSLQTAA
ncbi:hypothetical protein AB0442_38260 [Kitasatospora sp. NPDC085895]|uniref:hypothetical protein n=1 Tax=Kitasatospora sp. NPDC085895 TaxID=3155057 RepID=UPI00344F37D5